MLVIPPLSDRVPYISLDTITSQQKVESVSGLRDEESPPAGTPPAWHQAALHGRASSLFLQH